MRRHFVSVACATVLFFLAAGSASAQYGVVGPGPAGVSGEDYHVELAYALWFPEREIIVSSESLGIIGSKINAIEDLGFGEETFQDFRFVWRPGRKFKFRFGYTPIRYEGETVISRTIVFNGQRYDIGVPVVSEFDWKAWRFGMEWDFIYRSRGFLGLIVEGKYTHLNIALTSPIVAEFTEVKVPVPTIGGIGRVYIARNFQVTGEVTGLKLTIDEDTGQYFEYDFNGTFNFNRNFGVTGGFRKLDVEYSIERDSGTLDLSGLYIGGVARF